MTVELAARAELQVLLHPFHAGTRLRGRDGERRVTDRRCGTGREQGLVVLKHKAEEQPELPRRDPLLALEPVAEPVGAAAE